MYKIAIVQNEKEIFKYDCADWSKLIAEDKTLSYYKCEYYDENSIEKLFESLSLYDAVFFATNALNSQYTYSACFQNRIKIEEYIKSNHGLYIGYSSKNKERDFLPNDYKYKQTERDFTKETEFEGELTFISHYITKMYKEVDLKEYLCTANNHMTIAGLYFDYIELDINSQNYDSVIIDSEYNRGLLLCSKRTMGSRVVISTLPIDWQMHGILFNSIVRYCSEGLPSVDIISQEGSRISFFSQEFLFRKLNETKKPFKCTVLKEPIDLLGLYFHSEVIVFDSTWDEASVDGFCSNEKNYIINNDLRILHYHKQGNEGLYKLTVHSAFQQIDLTEKELLVFLESKCPDEKQKYSYDSSLLATFESLKVLQFNDIYCPELYVKIIENGKKRLLPDGSYDAMFVASCMFIAIWTMCDNDCKKDEEYKRLLNYINSTISERGDNISCYEKAQALYYLFSKKLSDENTCSKLTNDILKFIKETNENNLISYGMSNCWKVLAIVNCELDKDITKIIIQSIRQISFTFVSIIESIKLPIISNYLFSISSMIQNKKICLSEDNERTVYGFLFDATEFLNNKIKSGHIENDVFSSCLAIEALKKFYSLSIYPTDEIISLVSFGTSYKDRESYTIVQANDMLDLSKVISQELFQVKKELLMMHSKENELNAKVDEENLNVTIAKENLTSALKECDDLREELEKKTKSLNRRGVFSIVKSIALVIVIFMFIQMIFVYFKNKDVFISYFSSFYSFADWCAISTGIVVAVVEIIKYIQNKEE